jgi:hypothetical protein
MIDLEWSREVEQLPVPVAVLDAGDRFRLINEASRSDPLFAHVEVGEALLDTIESAPDLLSRAEARQRRFQESRASGRPVVFVEHHDGADAMQWLCVPVGEGEARQILVVGMVPSPWEASGERASDMLLSSLYDEIRAPLVSLVAMAASLASTTTGVNSERAQLINKTGRQLLRRVTKLLRTAHNDQGETAG